MVKSVLDYLENAASLYGERCAYRDAKQAFTFGQVRSMARRAGTPIAGLKAWNRPVAVFMEKSASMNVQVFQQLRLFQRLCVAQHTPFTVGFFDHSGKGAQLFPLHGSRVEKVLACGVPQEQDPLLRDIDAHRVLRVGRYRVEGPGGQSAQVQPERPLKCDVGRERFSAPYSSGTPVQSGCPLFSVYPDSRRPPHAHAAPPKRRWSVQAPH